MWAGPFFPFIVIYHPKQGSQVLKSSHPKGTRAISLSISRSTSIFIDG